MRIRSVLLTAALVATAAACGGDDKEATTTTGGSGDSVPAGSTATTTAAKPPKEGGTLTVLTIADVNTWDPARISPSAGAGGSEANAVYDTLVRVNADGTVVPRLAASVASSDQINWKITLKPGITFSDNTPLNAAAVVFNWERKRDLPTSICRPSLAALASFTAADDLTVNVTLKAAQGRWPTELEDCLGVIGSPTFIREQAGQVDNKPVGAGPFVLREHVRGAQATLDANPKFWDAPRPYVDTLIFKGVPDDAQRANGALANQAQVAQYGSPSVDLQRLKKAGFTLGSAPLYGGAGAMLNLRKPPTDDVRIRQAIQLATNSQDLLDKAFEGGTAPTTFFPEGHPFYDADVKVPEENLAEAQKLVDAYIAEKGGPVSFSILGAGFFTPVATAWSQQLNRVKGFEVKVDVKDPAGFAQANVSRDFSALNSAIAGPDPDSGSTGFYSQMHSTPAPNGNLAGINLPELDTLLDQARGTTDAAVRKQAYNDAAKLIFEQVPFIFMWRLEVTTASAKEVVGITYHGRSVADYSGTWLDK